MSDVCVECGEIPQGVVCSKGRNAGFPHKMMGSGWGSGRGPTSPLSQRSKSPPSPRQGVPSYVKHPPSGTAAASAYPLSGESRGSRRSRSSRSYSGRSRSGKRRRRSSSPDGSMSGGSSAGGRRRRSSRGGGSRRRRSSSPGFSSYSKSPVRSPRQISGSFKFAPEAPVVSHPRSVPPPPSPTSPVPLLNSAGSLQMVPSSQRIWAGAAVERNPAYWDSGNADGGAGNRGTVLDLGEGWVQVRWNGVGEATHRWGEAGAYDVSIVSHAQMSVPMPGTPEEAAALIPASSVTAPAFQRESFGKREVVQSLPIRAATSSRSVETEKAFCRVRIEGMRSASKLHYKLHLGSPFSQMMSEIFSQVPELAPPEWHLFWESKEGVRVPLPTDDTPAKVGMAPGLQNIHQLLLSQREDGWVTPRERALGSPIEPLHPIPQMSGQWTATEAPTPIAMESHGSLGSSQPKRSSPQESPTRIPFPGNRPEAGALAAPVVHTHSLVDVREKAAQEERIVLLETENQLLRDRISLASAPPPPPPLPLPLPTSPDGSPHSLPSAVRLVKEAQTVLAEVAVQTQRERERDTSGDSSDGRSGSDGRPPRRSTFSLYSHNGRDDHVWSSRSSPRAPHRTSGISLLSSTYQRSFGERELSPSRDSGSPRFVGRDPEEECRQAYLRLKDVYRNYKTFNPGGERCELDRVLRWIQLSGVAVANRVPEASITRALTGLLGTSQQKPPLSFEEFTEAMHLVGTLMFPRDESPLNSLLQAFY